LDDEIGGEEIAMASAEKLRKTMVKQGVPKEILAQFEFRDAIGKPTPVLSLVTQMDALLTPEQTLAIMQEQGCCVTGEPDMVYRAFGQENAGKTVAERIPLLANIDTAHKYNEKLNTDGTLSVWWGEVGGYNGCPCRVMRKEPRPWHVSKTHCACCGGHVRHHLQNGLGVDLKLREVVSSSANSDGKERCEFLFEIVEDKS
jgi:hypothetical protein